jgi:hypothetical protein
MRRYGRSGVCAAMGSRVGPTARTPRGSEMLPVCGRPVRAARIERRDYEPAPKRRGSSVAINESS